MGRAQGVSLPDVTCLAWVSVRRPTSELALPLITDLGPGETQVLMLALESSDAVVVLDDALARQVAEMLDIRLTSTLGCCSMPSVSGLYRLLLPC